MNQPEPKPPDHFANWFSQQLSANINIPYNNNSISVDKQIHFGNNEHNNKFVQSYNYDKDCTTKFNFVPLPVFDYNNQIKKISAKYHKNTTKIFNDNTLTIKKQNIKAKSNTTKYDKQIKNLNKIIKAKTIRFFPDNKQINTLNKWLNEATKLYNYCCDKFNQNPKFFNDHYTKTKITIFQGLYGNNEKKCPYDILTNEVKRFHANIKSCYTNLRNKNITHFQMKHKNVIKSQSICIPYSAVSDNSFYASHLGKSIKGLDNIGNTTNDCFVVRDKINNLYKIIIPAYHDKLKITHKREPIVALDPGEKIFMAYHGMNSYGKIGIDIRKPILKYQKKIGKYQSILSKGINRKGKYMNNSKKKQLRKHIQRNYNKIRNYVKELHNKTALFLCRNYERILIPKFETQKMVSNGMSVDHKKRLRNYNIAAGYEEDAGYGKYIKKYYNRKSRLSTRVKFVLNSLSHYKFREHLLNKSQEYGCAVKIVGEEYTSMTCTNCGFKSKSYNNRIKSCSDCKYKLDRDIGGSRNILIKNLDSEIRKANKSGKEVSQ